MTPEQRAKKNAYKRAWYQQHRDELLAKGKAEYWANVGESRAYKAAYAKKVRQRRKSNPGQYAEWRKKNADQCRQHCTGWTAEDVERQWNIQGGRCAICGVQMVRGGRSKHSMAADHDRKTGQKRGLVCNVHNRGLGMFDDSPDLLRAAANYLDQFSHSDKNAA